jgi:hypothetical protein
MRLVDRKLCQTWNQAVAAVRAACASLPEHLPLTEDDFRLLVVVLNICDQLSYGKELTRWRSNSELGKKYACSRRTICNWRAAGAPLAKGQWAMLDWLARRHCLPRGTRLKFKAPFEKRQGPTTRQTGQAKALQKLVRAGTRLGWW